MMIIPSSRVHLYFFTSHLSQLGENIFIVFGLVAYNKLSGVNYLKFYISKLTNI